MSEAMRFQKTGCNAALPRVGRWCGKPVAGSAVKQAMPWYNSR